MHGTGGIYELDARLCRRYATENAGALDEYPTRR
jgi:hypothetical protein